MPDWAGRENVETAKDVEHKKLVALDWLRAATVLMLLYDHIGAYRNPEWEIKKLVDFFIRKRRKTPVFRHGDIRRVHLICVSN